MAYTLSDVETLPALTAPMALALARSLLTFSLPILKAKPTRGFRTAVERIRKEGEGLCSRYLAATVASLESVVLLAGTNEDCAVSTVRSRLHHFEILPVGHPWRVEAGRVRGLIFPASDFVTGKSRKEWTKAKAIHQRVAEHGLSESLHVLVGEMFMSHLSATHTAFEDVLNVTATVPPAPPLLEPFARLREALSIYVQVVVVGARNEEINLKHALEALEPVAKLKADMGQAEEADSQS